MNVQSNQGHGRWVHDCAARWWRNAIAGLRPSEVEPSRDIMSHRFLHHPQPHLPLKMLMAHCPSSPSKNMHTLFGPSCSSPPLSGKEASKSKSPHGLVYALVFNFRQGVGFVQTPHSSFNPRPSLPATVSWCISERGVKCSNHFFTYKAQTYT